MRPVREEGRRAAAPVEASELDRAFRGLRAALRAFYRARLDATRRGVPARDVAAAVRALLAEQRAAVKQLTQRRQEDKAAQRDKRAVERHAAREATQRARGGRFARAGPG